MHLFRLINSFLVAGVVGFLSAKSVYAVDATLFAKGEELAKICVMCHGEAGISPNPRVPHLAGQHEVYLLKQLNDFRSRRRFNSAMRQVTSGLDDEQLKALAHYYSQLPR